MDHALKQCLELLKDHPDGWIHFGICDLKSLFHLILLQGSCWNLLVVKAKDPKVNWRYFVDKCLPFGASISCAIFQHFSNALAHVHKFLRNLKYLKIQFGLTNYLDNFLHFALAKLLCDGSLLLFKQLCHRLGMPLAEEKLVWGMTQIVFLGILLDGKYYWLAVPEEKKESIAVTAIFYHPVQNYSKGSTKTDWSAQLLKSGYSPRQSVHQKDVCKDIPQNWQTQTATSCQFGPRVQIWLCSVVVLLNTGRLKLIKL